MKAGWIHVDCPLCGARNAEVVYEREHDTGKVLGRFRAREVLCACGFLYRNPRPGPELMARYYLEASDSSASTLHGAAQGPRQRKLNGSRAAFIRRCLDEHLDGRQERFLDVGCAAGDLLVGLGLQGWRLSGVDPAEAATAAAAERGIDVQRCVVEEADLPQAGFDAVSCMSTLEHVPDPSACLAAMAEAVRDGGLLFLEVPDSNRPVAQLSEFFSFEHVSHFTPGTLRRMLAQHRLDWIETDADTEPCRLRICARRGATPEDPGDASADRQRLLDVITRYKREREALTAAIRGRLEPVARSWRDDGKRAAIYGAGMHSRFLLDAVDLSGSIACVLDSDARKAGSRFLGWEIHGPDRIPELELDAILISSRAFEDEIHAAIAPVCAEHSIDLWTCYGD